MTLDEHIKQTGVSNKDFGDEVGASPHAVKKWRRGERVPRPAMMQKIFEASKGAVDFSSWYPAPAE